MREQTGVIADWLARQIGADSFESDADRITLRISDRVYTLLIDPDFLAAFPPGRALAKVAEWRIPDELCRAEGLQFVLTPSGLRLASSN